ncbi:VOC family protein [Sporolactobacillus laevolacticus]|uniref:VOC family protein n=1 Tax=Sporolactobacillus laevolacticus TaxID=33018 RepID=UPI0025B5A241|nr:VOC family protein [Sporolactobacillus laevolacticus]MDN3956823.1 VOC family protein [Sporolactobacillus laevolacticus]
MIDKLGQVMLYVTNQDDSLKFWTEKAGFHLVSKEDNGQGLRWFEIAPSEEAETSIVLHNKELIAKMQPELNLGAPSLLFFTEDLDALYKNFTNKNITVGDIVTMPTGRVFNFADNEGNYFAVLEKK